jgi:hypothetical protein
MSIDKALNIITSQHRDKVKFIGWVTAPLQIVDDVASIDISAAYDLDLAVGIQLDNLGEIIGRKRQVTFQPSGGISPALSDDKYRMVLRAKILQNQWDGTIEQIYTIWNSIFPDIMFIVEDKKDMTMNVVIFNMNTTLDQELVASGYIIPKPQGVYINYFFKAGYVFGYGVYNNLIRGYEEGEWL